jgi:high-affinity nickel-transport protein
MPALRSLRRLSCSVTAAEWRRLGLMFGVIALLHAIGFFLVFFVVAPHHYALGKEGAYTAGIGLTACTLVPVMRSTPTTSPRSTTRRAS